MKCDISHFFYCKAKAVKRTLFQFPRSPYIFFFSIPDLDFGVHTNISSLLSRFHAIRPSLEQATGRFSLISAIQPKFNHVLWLVDIQSNGVARISKDLPRLMLPQAPEIAELSAGKRTLFKIRPWRAIRRVE
jgi:hypothetical protein